MSSFNLTTRKILEQVFRTVRVQIPPETLSVLTQVRRTLEIGDLFSSVLEHGQQTPGVAAVLGPREARRYVEELNQIYGTHHTMKDLTPVMLDGKKCYFILVAGHRRLETCMQINQQVAKGEIPSTPAYEGKYRVELRFGLTTKQAIALQFSENRHVQVPPHEEAQSAWGYWKWLSKQEPGLTIAQFGRMISRSSEWVRSALRFCELPTFVQDYVDGSRGRPRLPYGVLVGVARLADGYRDITGETLTEEAYHRWLHRAFIGRLDATRFGKMVSDYLKEKRSEKNGQFSLFGGSDAVVDTRPIRRIVAQEMIRDLWRWLEYMKVVQRLQQSGQLGPASFLGPESEARVLQSYSPGSPIRLLSRAAEMQVELLPHLVELASREGGRGRRKLQALGVPVEEIKIVTALLARFESTKASQIRVH